MGIIHGMPLVAVQKSVLYGFSNKCKMEPETTVEINLSVADPDGFLHKVDSN